MTTPFQLPTYAGLQQGAPQQAPNQSALNPISGVGTAPAASASQPSGGVQPQPQWQQQPQPNLQPPGFPQPNFQQPITQQPPAQQTWQQPSPITAAPVQQPEVSPYIQELERLGRVPVGRFRNDRELGETLYNISEEMAARLEEYEKRYGTQPVAAAPTTPQPVQPAPAPVATAADVTQIATVFQQNGLLNFNNGQWVATNPMAAAVAEQLNRSALEAQARQAELANPSAFIQKYGQDVIGKAVDPLRQQLEDLARQNQALQERFENSVPRPDRDWVNQNRSVLYTKDASGREVETQIGALYRTAWNNASQSGKGAYADIHAQALEVIKPLLPNQQQPQVRQPWMAGVQNPQSNMYATDPSFTAPGTLFNNGVSPQHQGRPLGNDGFPTFAALQQQMAQGI